MSTGEPQTSAVEVVLAGGGDMGALMRSHDWAASPVGAVEEWPQSLRTAVSIALASGYPMLIVWGPEFVQFYNDAFRPILGSSKHPAALGGSARATWGEIWEAIGAMFAQVFEGEEVGARDAPFVLDRNGYPEETYFDFSYSPIRDETGSVGGVFVTCMETTQRVLGDRRMGTLRELGTRTGAVERAELACEVAAEVLGGNPADVPFALLYLADEGGEQLQLVGRVGVEPGGPASPAAVGRGEDASWPLFAALDGGEPVVVDDVVARFGELPGSPWPESPHTALVLPVSGSGPGAPTGVLVAGISARRALDDDYQGFLELAAGQVATAVARARAVEDAQERAEVLAELDRAKTVFFSNVSHEFRTPLTLMLAPLDDALADGALGAAQRERLELVRRNALRLLDLVNTLLDFAQLEAGRELEASYTPTELGALTRELTSAFQSSVERAGLRLVIDSEPLASPVYVDPDMWERIVLNLVSNALKFTFEGEIEVGLHGSDGTAVLTVRDTGTGIPEEELPHLFERFHRVRGARARTQEGAGIGLAIVQELVRLHGGSIGVESEAGVGTTFTVTFPLGRAHLPTERIVSTPAPAAGGRRELVVPDGKDAPPAGGSGRRILLADDNPDMRAYLTRLLSQHWTVEPFAEGRSALDAARARPPDLVLADVMMPGLDGFQLLAALRGDPRTAAVPVILVSARAGEESAVDGIDAGADDYLVKPFSARELVARVRMNLELAQLRTEAGRLFALEEIRSRVITTVSHELRTPVSAIYGASKTLENAGLIDPNTQRELLSVITGQSERLARITSDILTTETLASGMLSLASQTLDARLVVNEAVAAASVIAPPDAEIHAVVPDAAVYVRADRGRLQQILANLIDNALKYSREAAEVTVAVETLDDAVRFAVSDRGVGVPARQREQIFRRFFRADPDQADGVGGSGLGLYICRELVEAMGGQIWAEANEDRGARFVVLLPRAS